MSPVVDLQRRMREIGRIRMGEKKVSKNGKAYPAAIERFRFTCASRGLLDRMAETVGGEVTEWADSPTGDQWQLYSTSSEIAVVVPPMDEPFSQFYELWSGGGCQRRCDGVRATVAVKEGTGNDAPVVMREKGCVCDSEARECKLTTRAGFILPWAPGIGVWRLESHGYNAAVELTGTLTYLARQAAQGVYMECRLRLEKREKKVPGQPTNEYVVPVLDTDATPAQLMAGGLEQTAPQIASRERPALPAGGDPPNGKAAGFTDPDPPAAGEPGWGAAPEVPTGEAAVRAEVDEPDEPTTITEAQRRRLFAIAKSAGVTRDQVKGIVLALTHQDSTGAITRAQYDEIVESVERMGKESLFDAPEPTDGQAVLAGLKAKDGPPDPDAA